MAKRDRSARRAARESGENSENTAAGRDGAVDQETDQIVGAAATAAAVAATTAANAAGAGTAPVGLEAVLGMLAQVLARLPAAAPVQTGPPPVVENLVVEDVEVLNAPRPPSYLKVTEHMQKLGTKFFAGGTKPIVADEWVSRLERNFESIRCPEAYKKDIAVHYLEADAHMWWQSVMGRPGMHACTWGHFRAEFRSKYFPQEAFDRLEGEFLDLRQGTMTVREYVTEFNSLKRYAGREMDEESTQVRRFMRGFRVELWNRCQIRSYNSVTELVEKAAQQEAGMLEEAKLLGDGLQGQSSNAGKNNKKWVKNALRASHLRVAVCV